MEPSRTDLLSALKEAEEFISITLANENLSSETERKRQQLQVRLKCLNEDEDKPPLPQPRHAPVPEANQDEDQEELYDDVQGNTTFLNITGVSTESEDHNNRNNMVKNEQTFETEVVEDFYDDTVPEESGKGAHTTNHQNKISEAETEEFYDDTVPEESRNAANANEVETYEVAETKNTENENHDEEDFYEGVDISNDDKKSLDSLQTRDRSATQQLESLAVPIKPEDVEDVIMKGTLDKHRKKGIYIGSKWQKRYCVIRSFAMYYYTGVNAAAQKGTIILPGYKATAHKSTRNNGKEFMLTREDDRSYIFMAESKESADKWIEALTKAANTSQMSNRQSEIIDNLRKTSGVGEEDTSSLCNDDDKNSINNVPAAKPDENGEIYDDVQGGEADNISASADDIDYEIPGATDTQDNQSTELYEAPLEETENEPPSSYPKLPPKPPVEEDVEDYEMPEENDTNSMTPPQTHTLKPPPEEIPPVSEDEEEIYDDIIQPEPLPPPVESKPPIPSKRPLPNENKPSPPVTRTAPQLPLPPTPQETEIQVPSIPPRRTEAPPLKEEPSNNITPEITTKSESTPPPLPPSKGTIESKGPAPPPPPEEEGPKEKAIIDYSSIYQALWDCDPDAEDELQFKRGDLIYIYEKPHSDWWIGSRYKPQGYETRLIPKNYLTEAFNL